LSAKSHATAVAHALGFCGGPGNPIDSSTRKQTSLLHFGFQDPVNPRLLPVFGPNKLRVYGPPRFKEVKPDRPAKLAPAMQLIVFFATANSSRPVLKTSKVLFAVPTLVKNI